MGNRVSSAQIPNGHSSAVRLLATRRNISQLPHPPRQHTLCITDREAKNHYEKKIKLSFLQIWSVFFVASASKINADEQFTGPTKFFSKYGKHNTCEWIYLKVALLHRRPAFLALRYRFSLNEKGTTGEDPGGRLSGRKHAECISISFSRLLLAKMIIVVSLKQLFLASCCNSEMREHTKENDIVHGTLSRFIAIIISIIITSSDTRTFLELRLKVSFQVFF